MRLSFHLFIYLFINSFVALGITARASYVRGCISTKNDENNSDLSILVTRHL